MHHPITPLSAIGIIRYHRPDEAYLKLRNNFARNARISLRAFRVASLILSHADGFVQTQVQIAQDCGLSVNTVRHALEDLRQDGYLVSRIIREHGRVIGTAYAVSDVPFTDAERIALSEPCADSACTGSACAESDGPKKISSRRETTTQEKTTPSGGATAAAAPPSLEVPSALTQEDPVAKPAGDLALFDAPEVAPRQAGKTGAQAIVATWIDSYRKHHGGEDPLKPDIGRVARDAKGILTRGEAGEDELSAAAVAMGQGIYVNLAMALKRLREDKRPARPGARQGMAPASPHTDPYWQEVGRRNETEWYQQLQTDDAAVEWVRQDPTVVDELCAKWPELADRLRGAA